MTSSIVIVGASAAGVSAALTLRQGGYDGTVTLLSAEDRLPYERPAVSKGILLTGEAPLIAPQETYAEQRIDLRLNESAADIDLRGGTVTCESGTVLAASKVLLATGGRVRRLTVPGSDLPGVCYARSAIDAEAIRDRLQPGARVVVIGGGLIGAEVAASAVQAGCQVIWLEAGYRCLTRALASPLDEVMMAIHRKAGVDIRTGANVIEIVGKSRAEAVKLAEGSLIPADVVVVGIGIVPETTLAEKAGAQLNNGVVVNDRCETSVPNLYAAGDVAAHSTRWMSGEGRLEHWRHAQEQGAAAARAMLGQDVSYQELPWFWTDQYDNHIEGCGLVFAGDEVIVRGSGESGSMTVFYLRNEVLVATSSLNQTNDVRAAMRLIMRGVTPPRSILSDPSIDLRKYERETARAVA